jgi:mono/diheme cytochrome c family protein
MRKILRYFFIGIGFLVVVLATGLSYVKIQLPDVGAAPDIKIEYTPERIEHGRYLATCVTVCMDCHSKRDFGKFAGPLVPGTLGMGGERFDESVGLPGVFVSSNITPEGIGRYTDGELVRVITTGVSKEGKAMFPLMPYSYYGRMDTEDIYSIIAYIRSIPPIKNEVQSSVADFPVNFIMNTIPKKAAPQKKPEPSDVLAYGKYMTNAAGCRECHTAEEKGRIIIEKAFSGGRQFAFPDGSKVNSSNLTPDNDTGIGRWTKEVFIQRFKVFADSSYVSPSVARGDFNSPMPWTMYGRMKKEDLGAIFEYLKSLAPIPNKVVRSF